MTEQQKPICGSLLLVGKEHFRCHMEAGHGGPHATIRQATRPGKDNLSRPCKIAWEQESVTADAGH